MIPDSKLTWFSFNPSEFLTRTIGLPNQDVGAYIKLLSYSWVNGPLPNNPKVLSSIAGKRDVELITARFFEVNEDGKLYDPRLEDQRVKAAGILEANRKRTEKASENRWKDSPSRRRDESVTATEDKDKDKDKETTGPEKTGDEKTGDEKTGDEKTRDEKTRPETTGQAGAPTLPPKLPVIPIDTRSIDKLKQKGISPQKESEHGPNYEVA